MEGAIESRDVSATESHFDETRGLTRKGEA